MEEEGSVQEVSQQSDLVLPLGSRFCVVKRFAPSSCWREFPFRFVNNPKAEDTSNSEKASCRAFEEDEAHDILRIGCPCTARRFTEVILVQ